MENTTLFKKCKWHFVLLLVAAWGLPTLSWGQRAAAPAAAATAHALASAYSARQPEAYFQALRTLYPTPAPELPGLMTPHDLYREAYANPILRPSLTEMYKLLLLTPVSNPTLTKPKTLTADYDSAVQRLARIEKAQIIQASLWEWEQKSQKVRNEWAWKIAQAYNRLLTQVTNTPNDTAALRPVLLQLRQQDAYLLDLLQNSANLGYILDNVLHPYAYQEKSIQEFLTNPANGRFKGLFTQYRKDLAATEDLKYKDGGYEEQFRDLAMIAGRIVTLERQSLTIALLMQQDNELAALGTNGATKNSGYTGYLNHPSAIRSTLNESLDAPVALLGPVKASTAVQPVTATMAAAHAAYETQLLNALADFLVTRFKEELTLTFFERFQQFLENGQKQKKKRGSSLDQEHLRQQLRCMFPVTLAQLQHVPQGTHAQVLSTLRMAFARDLQQVAFTAPGVLLLQLQQAQNNRNEENKNFLRDNGSSIRYIIVMLRALRPLSQGEHPATILARLDEMLRLTLTDTTMHAIRNSFLPALGVARLAADELRDPTPTPGNYWLTPKRMKALFPDSKSRQFLLGVAYEHLQRQLDSRLPQLAPAASPYQPAEVNKLTQHLKAQLADTAQLRAVWTQLYTITAGLETARDTLEKIRNLRALRGPDLLPYYKMAFGLGDLVVAQLIPPPTPENKQYKSFQAGARLALETHYAALDGRFDAAVVRLTELFDTLLTTRYDRTHQLFRYTTFLATMAQASDEATMQNAIRAMVLPPGSYTVKRRSLSSWSLNAFVGVTGGVELVNGKPAGNIGPAAPIGLAFSWGNRVTITRKDSANARKYNPRIDTSAVARRSWNRIRKYERNMLVRADKTGDTHYLRGTSGSIFFSLIDLGALANARLGGSSQLEGLPNTRFTQVFAPGLYCVHGIRNVPFSVFAGGSINPSARQFANNRSANAWRLNIGLVADIPLLHFSARTEP